MLYGQQSKRLELALWIIPASARHWYAPREKPEEDFDINSAIIRDTIYITDQKGRFDPRVDSYPRASHKR